jgi:hypothetical protein
VRIIADVVVVDAGEPVLGDAPVARALVIPRLKRLEGRPVLDAEATKVAEPRLLSVENRARWLRGMSNSLRGRTLQRA